MAHEFAQAGDVGEFAPKRGGGGPAVSDSLLRGSDERRLAWAAQSTSRRISRRRLEGGLDISSRRGN